MRDYGLAALVLGGADGFSQDLISKFGASRRRAPFSSPSHQRSAFRPKGSATGLIRSSHGSTTILVPMHGQSRPRASSLARLRVAQAPVALSTMLFPRRDDRERLRGPLVRWGRVETVNGVFRVRVDAPTSRIGADQRILPYL